MKKLILPSLFMLFLAQSGWTSETAKGAKKDYEKFKTEMSNKLDAADVKLAELRSKAKASGNSTKEKLALELEESKEKLRQQQEEIKYESSNSWKKMKKSMSDAAETLNSKIQSALKD